MTYSTGIPTLYFSTACQLTLIYWIDKYCLLTFCKKPKNLDQSLQLMV